MFQSTSTHKQFEALARDFLSRHPSVPHTWRPVRDAAGGRTDLICWPDTKVEVFASLTDYQITVGSSETRDDFEKFGRDLTDGDLAREAMAALESLINKRLGHETSDQTDKSGGQFNERMSAYRSTSEAEGWLDRNWKRLKELLSNVQLRDFIFEPIKGVFAAGGTDDASAIRQTITMVAVTNAVMAGLPGKMGVGVAVSIALEGWMAYVIALRVGITLRSVSDVWKYFGMLAAMAGVVLYGIRAALGLAFSLFSVVPGVNPMIFGELIVTNLVGVLFWVGFEEARLTGSFTVPARALRRIGTETKDLASFQWDIIRNNLSPSALVQMGSRLKAWLTGEIPIDRAVLRGQVAPAVLMAHVLASKHDQLEGPIGHEFMEAIRDRFPDLRGASVNQIGDHMKTYDAEQLVGVMNVVKGKLFERLVARHENADGDQWRAVMHEDESYPGSDIIFTDEGTGQSIELSLKATDNPSYVEAALLKYPDIPVLTTEEVSRFFSDDPRVTGATMSDEELTQITEENYERMLAQLTSVDIAQGAAAGVTAGATIGLWPFVVAFLAKRITQHQLEKACVRVLGESGVALTARVSYALLLGPVFAWYLLARGVMGLTRAAQQRAPSRSIKRLEWRGIARLSLIHISEPTRH